MTCDRLRSVSTARATALALLAALGGAGSAWTLNAGTALAPEPANVGAPLGSYSGATAAAVFNTKPQVTQVLIWSGNSWTRAPWLAIGTPCSTGPMLPGEITTKRIEGKYNLRRCVPYDPSQPPPANAVRPLPPMPVATGTGTKDAADALTTTVVEVTTVVNWPTDWRSSDGDPPMYAGQPCSDFPLLAGESTYKHLQAFNGSGSSEGPFRCVRIQDPIIYPGP